MQKLKTARLFKLNALLGIMPVQDLPYDKFIKMVKMGKGSMGNSRIFIWLFRYHFYFSIINVKTHFGVSFSFFIAIPYALIIFNRNRIINSIFKDKNNQEAYRYQTYKVNVHLFLFFLRSHSFFLFLPKYFNVAI